MTPKERKNPDLINHSRKLRIAKGCGRKLDEINAFIKQFNEMRDMMFKMSNGMMPGMPGGGMGGGAPKMPKLAAMPGKPKFGGNPFRKK